MLAAVALVCPAVAGAEPPPPLFWQVPIEGQSGSAAGRLDRAFGIAADQNSGHVYAGDVGNARIDEFTVWGEFVRAWGWGVLDGSPELQVCTTSSGCQEGIAGSGAGQLNFPKGMAVDSLGAVYVVDWENQRVQKFSSSGEFLLMFGGEVNKTTTGNVCTAASGDVCGVGVVGTGNGQFDFTDQFVDGTLGDYLDVGLAGTIYVGDKGRVQEFNPDGTYKAQIPTPKVVPVPQERNTKALAVDPNSGDLYVALAQELTVGQPEVPVFYRLDETTGAILDEIQAGDPEAEPAPIRGFAEALAVDSAGNVYMGGPQKQLSEQSWDAVLKFDPSGTCLICPGEEDENGEKFGQTAEGLDSGLGPKALATSTACDLPSDDLYITYLGKAKSYIRAYGPPANGEVCPPPLHAPTIEAQYAVSADDDSASVRTEINPHFWPDTTYYIEYGTEECALGGCATQPVPPGASLGGGSTNIPVTSKSIVLAGLEPETTYHFRFVAESSGGGPVRGVGGEVGVDGDEDTFTTFSAPPPVGPDPCPNALFRAGPSSGLADCRAYEMVSPVDKDNGDASPLGEVQRSRQLNQSSLNGERFTYSSYRAFADPQGAAFISQYMASRDPEQGWVSESISPPRGIRLLTITLTNDTEFKAFSPDLCSGWLRHDTDHPPFDPAAIPGYANLYRRANCDGGYEALTMLEPAIVEPNTAPLKFVPELQGLSADGSCAVFRANAKLTANASDAEIIEQGLYQLYESCDGELRLISILPNGTAANMNSAAGTASGADNTREGRAHSVLRAVSADGSRVYWTTTPPNEFDGDGKIYVRDNTGEEQSALAAGQCTEVEKACTYPVSETVSGTNAQFLAATPDGSKALFTIFGGDLYEFDFASKDSTPIAEGVDGLLGASEDLSRVYLVSSEDLDEGATGGDPNLYLYEGGAFEFIATLSDADVENDSTSRSPINKEPLQHSARVSPDGSHVAFMSTASLTGFDNIDANSGEADAEVFLYDASGAGELACVSCNPSGVRPSGRELTERALEGGSGLWAASALPTWENQLYAERALSEDGSRVYFESFEALVLGDTNGKQDVYQWEVEGKGGCDEADVTFNDASGGCVELISSGESSEDSEFLDATPDGSDVFFATGASLLGQDPGLIDVYDARVNGGLPPPVALKPPCEGEACQSPPAPPREPGTTSSTFRGPGNPPSGPSCASAARRAAKLSHRAEQLRQASQRANSQSRSQLMRRKADRLTEQAKRLSRDAKRCRAKLRASQGAGR